MPVRCWLVVFYVAQLMARMNRNVDMKHPCCTPDFTVHLVVEFPTLQEKFPQKIWMSVISFSGIP